ncbi:DUF3418 domain-containing protein [Actinomyces sp. B33]|uniref:DUF3418 domain-containing protein n=1 Tax=Actinomyces sp. B33 TaxID=2942131 RepID=UPI002341D013|nr:DUF3418 domain-containing protein [Actinomyces sp. B33]MDC4232442.1 DUF3418 domain-containing protein [Actinomyces sp. B33]
MPENLESCGSGEPGRSHGGRRPRRLSGEAGKRRKRENPRNPKESQKKKPRRTHRPHHERARAFRPFTADQLAARAAAIPVIDYPDLPVSARRDEIAAAIRDHQVVIVSGETGSGKTTQLPKICLQLGRGVAGMIGHTQPRRIAARSVADRIADELGQEVGKDPGQVVGYQVRFTDEVGPTTLVKLMTDGILLAEIQSDPLLRRYDTLIIDEAHERSLNIDFILGYLARLLPMRPDLKVVITSATIDSARFAEHFGAWEGAPGRGRLIAPAPVIEVSGRTFPVEIRYRPLAADLPTSYSSQSPADTAPAADPPGSDIGGRGGASGPAADPESDSPGREHLVLEDPDDDLPTLGYGMGEDLDVEQAICRAVDELAAEGDGDILVFLPGERDIRDTEQALLDHLGPRGVRAGHDRGARASDIEIVPLFARLTAAEQHRVFEPHRLRRVVLATNVAETSLTVPGIRYVIDPGLARVSRYSNRTKVQRLPIEPVSRASADQRAGRCGRVADGIAIRLYSQRDYEARPRFTEPEILRTSLASVILQMASLGLGEVTDFPFLDAPDRRAVRDGVQLLVEIGALEPDATAGAGGHRLTRIGRDLARLPIDPRLGRMLIEGDANGCASEVLVIVAALSIQDVRERPAEHQAAADASHARLADPHSDFITYLNLWRYLHVQQRDLSGAAFRRLCRTEFLHYLRFREWRDVVSQLRQMARPLDLDAHPIGEPSTDDVEWMASHGPADEAAARAVVAYTQGANSVDADEIHRSLLVGLLSNLGSWDEAKREYRGARGTRFTIWPGSGLARSRPAWVMTAELVETSRLFARTVARIRPEWVEPVAGPLLKRVYSEPFWSTSKGAAMVKEKVLLYGLTLVADRPVLLGRLGDLVLDEGSVGRGPVAVPGTLAGIAQGLLGSSEGSGGFGSEPIGSVGRDILAMALAGELAGIAEGPEGPGGVPSDGAHDVSESAAAPGVDVERPTTGAGAERDSRDGAHEDGPVGAREDEEPLTARALAREMLIRHGLVAGQWRERHAFQRRNEELLDQAREVERRSRTHGLVADEEARARFFDDVLPDDVVSAGHFSHWWKREREKRPDLLTYTSSLLLPRGRGEGEEGFPDQWSSGEVELPLDYRFTPGAMRDGVTMTIPIEVLDRVSEEGTDWLVPGMLEELVTETIRALPKAKRRLLAPAPEVGAKAAAWMRRALDGRVDVGEARAPAGADPSDGDDPMSLSAAMDRLARWGASTGMASRSGASARRSAAGAAPEPGPNGSASAPTVGAGSCAAGGEGSRPTPGGVLDGSSSEGVDWSVRRPTFATAFSHAVRVLRGVDLSDSDLAHAAARLPSHLRMTFVVVDRSGRELGAGEDLAHLQRTLAGQADRAIRSAVRGAVAEAFADAAQNRSARGRKGRRGDPGAAQERPGGAAEPGSPVFAAAPGTPAGDRPSAPDRGSDSAPAPTPLDADGLVAFPDRPLPRSVESPGARGLTLRGFPALVPQGTAADPSAGVRIMANAADADRRHREGLARLLLIRVRLPQARVTTRWTGRQALMLAASPYPGTADLVADAQAASCLSLVDELAGPQGPGSIRSAEAFEAIASRARDLHEDRVYEILGHVVRAMEAQAEAEEALRSHGAASMSRVTADVRENTRRLSHPGFLVETPFSALPHLARYLRAGAVRLARAGASPGALARDEEDMGRVHEVEALLAREAERTRSLPYDAVRAGEVERASWMIQELRVSMFAQQLGTPQKVSVKRILGLLGPVGDAG